MKRVSSGLPRIIAAVAAAAIASSCIPAQPRAVSVPDRGALILRLGLDTLFVERFELSRNRLYVESAVRTPAALFRTIDATLNDDGSFASIAVATFDPANPRGREARDSATVTFSPDSTVYAFGIGERKQVLRLAGRGDLVISVPGNYWFPNHVLLAARAPRTAGDSLLGTTTSRLGANPLVVKRVAPDTVTIWTQLAGLMRVMLGPDGRAVGLDGTGSSLGYVASRVDWIDIDSVSRAFAARERATGTVGALSARDTVRAEIDGARLIVDYGRPAKRGRTIFGGVVPWDRVWRTGANLATHFSTSRPLQFGEEKLPAGEYTLHSIPAPGSWTLLVSSRIGQWGTSALDPTTIVARIPMAAGSSREIVETFTITLEPRAGGGAIRLAWDTTFAEASFVVR
ncbi:hypothetical protein BH23GEM1_BH23GEM1_01020 [soil metagenome]